MFSKDLQEGGLDTPEHASMGGTPLTRQASCALEPAPAPQEPGLMVRVKNQLYKLQVNSSFFQAKIQTCICKVILTKK